MAETDNRNKEEMISYYEARIEVLVKENKELKDMNIWYQKRCDSLHKLAYPETLT